MDLHAASSYILNRMAKELRPNYYYHGVEHTLDVHRACLKLAEMEGINHNDLVLLETAAFYHDSGILEVYENHEEASVKIAREVLPRFGYTWEQINIIDYIILKTKLPQSAITQLGEVLCDADLDYLGRPDFFMISHRLRYEWELLGKHYNLKDWYEMQLNFLGNHKYYTRSARKLRNEGKEQNILEIKRVLGKF